MYLKYHEPKKNPRYQSFEDTILIIYSTLVTWGYVQKRGQFCSEFILYKFNGLTLHETASNKCYNINVK